MTETEAKKVLIAHALCSIEDEWFADFACHFCPFGSFKMQHPHYVCEYDCDLVPEAKAVMEGCIWRKNH